jgi:hypothetical protein
MSEQRREAWHTAEEEGFDSASVAALLAIIEQERQEYGQELLTRQTVLDIATVRGTAAAANWREGGYGAAIWNGALAVTESLSIGAGIFGESAADTAKNITIEGAASVFGGFLFGRLGRLFGRSGEEAAESAAGGQSTADEAFRHQDEFVGPQRMREQPVQPSRGALDRGANTAVTREQLRGEQAGFVRLLRRRALGTDPARGYIPHEARGAAKLEARLGRRLQRSLDETIDWVDDAGRTYDLLGPVPSEHFVLESFVEAVDTHLRKADFPVIDLEGLTDVQVRHLLRRLSTELDVDEMGRIILLD